MNILNYHVFINLLLNYKIYNLTFSNKDNLFYFLLQPEQLFCSHFPHTLFCFLNNITRDYSQKWKLEKQNETIITKPVKKNSKKNCKNYRNLPENEKIIKRNYADTKSEKNMTVTDRERKKYIRNC